MVLESTMICVDNSDYMRNGDFLPTRLHAQQDAVDLVCHSKTRSNPENNVGLLTLAKGEVLATLTNDVGRILSKLYQVQPHGEINFHIGIQIAHLALKHRQGKNHRMRVVAFVGSPVKSEKKELVQLAKKLKKEKVNVDVVSFGEDAANSEVLTTFVNTLNGKEGTSSHLVTVPPGTQLSDALISSPIIQGEDGTGAIGLGGSRFEFGFDPNEDPDLAMALRISMEEERQRQEEAHRTNEISSSKTGVKTDTVKENSSEEGTWAISMEKGRKKSATTNRPPVDFANLTEDEQIAFALQMSMKDTQEPSTSATGDKEESMEAEGDEDYSEVMNNPEYFQSVLENIPGVDPQSEAIRKSKTSLKDKKKEDKPDENRKK